jgi:hypothetical protein
MKLYWGSDDVALVSSLQPPTGGLDSVASNLKEVMVL